MDFAINRAMLIAVGVIVTITIATGVMIAINQIIGIYGYVNSTDISIKNKFNEFTMYDNTVKTGADLLNTAKKYLGNGKVRVMYNDVAINTESNISQISEKLKAGNDPDYRYEWKYTVSYIPENENPEERNIITFNKQ